MIYEGKKSKEPNLKSGPGGEGKKQSKKRANIPRLRPTEPKEQTGNVGARAKVWRAPYGKKKKKKTLTNRRIWTQGWKKRDYATTQNQGARGREVNPREPKVL